MLKRSCEHLTPQQSRRLAKLLYACENLFAKDDFDIDIFNIEIEHKIDNTDSLTSNSTENERNATWI